MSAKIIVALDNMEVDQALTVVAKLQSAGIEWVKVGLELYTKGGNKLIETLKSKGHKVFLDLKLYDIPNTVAQTIKSIESMGVDLTTVHAMGGIKMLESAQGALSKNTLNIVAVTLLTSFSDYEIENLLPEKIINKNNLKKEWFLHLLTQTKEAGLSGIVSSAQELNEYKSELSKLNWKSKPIFVTPGIRFSEDATQDQARVLDPKSAAENGATHLVVGRPILQPASGTIEEAAKKFLKALQ